MTQRGHMSDQPYRTSSAACGDLWVSPGGQDQAHKPSEVVRLRSAERRCRRLRGRSFEKGSRACPGMKMPTKGFIQMTCFLNFPGLWGESSQAHKPRM